jgi:hypothetical protein
VQFQPVGLDRNYRQRAALPLRWFKQAGSTDLYRQNRARGGSGQLKALPSPGGL